MAAPTKREWYYLAQDQRHGPLSLEEISKKVMAREVFPEDSHVWRQGMKDWEVLDTCKAFATVIKTLREREAAVDARAREAGSATSWDAGSDAVGISRGVFHFYVYVGWLIPMLLCVILLTELQVHGGAAVFKQIKPNFFSLIPLAVATLLMLKVAGERLNNAGYSKKMGLGLLVPIYNLWVLFLCLFAPAHYKQSKKFGAGAFGSFVFVGLYAAGIFLLVVPMLGAEKILPHNVGLGLETFYKGKSNFKGRVPSYDKKK